MQKFLDGHPKKIKIFKIVSPIAKVSYSLQKHKS
jgi:hypothetical protein